MTRLLLIGFLSVLLGSHSVSFAATGSFGSADDLDLDGDFVYAVDVRGVGGSVAGVNFTNDSVTGVSISATSSHDNWAQKPDYTGTDEAALENIMHDIRFSSGGANMGIDLAVVSGQTYKLQLLFSENFWGHATRRTFDVVVDGTTIVDEFDIAMLQGDPVGTAAPPRPDRPLRGAFILETIVANSSTMDIDFIQGTTGVDGNPLINAFTLEVIPEPSSLCLTVLGAIGLGWRFRRGK